MRGARALCVLAVLWLVSLGVAAVRASRLLARANGSFSQHEEQDQCHRVRDATGRDWGGSFLPSRPGSFLASSEALNHRRVVVGTAELKPRPGGEDLYHRLAASPSIPAAAGERPGREVGEKDDATRWDSTSTWTTPVISAGLEAGEMAAGAKGLDLG